MKLSVLFSLICGACALPVQQIEKRALQDVANMIAAQKNELISQANGALPAPIYDSDSEALPVATSLAKDPLYLSALAEVDSGGIYYDSSPKAKGSEKDVVITLAVEEQPTSRVFSSNHPQTSLPSVTISDALITSSNQHMSTKSAAVVQHKDKNAAIISSVLATASMSPQLASYEYALLLSMGFTVNPIAHAVNTVGHTVSLLASRP